MLIDEFAREKSVNGTPISFSAPALEALRRHNWPGNIRELANLIERMSILKAGTVIEAADLPVEYQSIVPTEVEECDAPNVHVWLDQGEIDLKQHIQDIERQLIKQALAQSGGVVAEAARFLKVGRTTLVEKIRKYAIDTDQHALVA